MSETPRTAVILSVSITGLGAVRSLHRAGVPTVAVAENPTEPVLFSRLPRQKLLVRSKDPGERDQNLLRTLETIEDARPVLIPTSDSFVSFMVRNRRRLAERFDFTLPDDELVSLFLDKAKETAAIENLGIPLPNKVFRSLRTSCWNYWIYQ
jgi:predicted ATP-grasp superfamily ATP-dependent carboligase